MTISINACDSDIDLIAKLKSRLKSNFEPYSSDCIEDAVELATYLVVLDKLEEASELLDSFVYFSPNSRSLELWVQNADGVLLKGHIAKLEGDNELYQNIMKTLQGNDLYPTDIGKIRWVRMHITDHAKEMKYAQTEKKNNKCMIIKQQFLNFLYFHESIFEFSNPTLLEKLLLSRASCMMEESKNALVNALKEGSKKRDEVMSGL